MFQFLSFLARKKRRRILSVILTMFRGGYTSDEVLAVLRVVKANKLKGAQIRSATSALKKTRKKLTKARNTIRSLAAQSDASVPVCVTPSETARVLAEEFGHTRTVAEWLCVNKDGNPIPWYTYPAIEYLLGLDFSEKDVFEYGSGYSTLFWSRQARGIVSVEHDPEWHARMSPMIPENVSYRLMPDKMAYLGTINERPRRFDVVVIDGEHRDECVPFALDKLKEDGLIILDNSDWFPGATSLLRAANLIQVDMHGFGPINHYTWTTSLFFRRGTALKPSHARQPFPGPGSLLEVAGVSINPKVDKPSLNGLDEKLARYLDYRNGFFIEAGANDGYSQSNTYYLENSMGWSGILIEGIPDLAEMCRKNRARSKVVGCALVADQEATTTVKMRFANLMSVVEGSLGERTDEHVQLGLKVQNLAESYEVNVPTRTLTSILDELAPGRPIDFFSLDVEGYELEVLRGLDLELHAPTFMLIETWKPDEVTELLRDRYEMIEQLSVHDYLFKAVVRNHFLEPPSS